MTKSEPTLAYQAVIVFLGKMLTVMIRFAIPVIFVRIFTSHEYGIYRMILFLGMFFEPLFRLGLPESLYYLYSKEKHSREQLLWQTYAVLISIGTLILLVFALFGDSIGRILKNEVIETYALPIGLLALFNIVYTYFEYMFIIEKRPFLTLCYNVMPQVVLVAFSLIAYIIFGNLIAVLWAFVAQAFLRWAVFSIYVIVKKRLYRYLFRWDLALSRKQLTFAVPMGGGKLVGELGRKLDQLLISMLMTPSAFAIYSIGRFRIPFIDQLYASVGSVALARISKDMHSGNIKSVVVLWHKVVANYSKITLPLLVYVEVVAYPLITFIYSDQYQESVIIFRIIITFLAFQMLSFGSILWAKGESKLIFRANLLSFILGGGLSALLIPLFGLIGGAVATTIAFAANAITQLFYTRILLGLPTNKWLPWKSMSLALLTSLVSATLLVPLMQLEISKVGQLFLTSAVFFSVVALLYHVTGQLNVPDLVRQIKGIEKRK